MITGDNIHTCQNCYWEDQCQADEICEFYDSILDELVELGSAINNEEPLEWRMYGHLESVAE